MSSLTLDALPGGEDTAGASGGTGACARLGCPWACSSTRGGRHARPAVGNQRSQGSRRPGRGRGALGCPWRCRSPTHAPRGPLESLTALPRPWGRGEPVITQARWGATAPTPSQTLPLNALKLQRHGEPLRGAPVSSSPTCVVRPRVRGACRPTAPAGPAVPALSLGSPFASPVGGGPRTFGQLLGLPCALRPRQEGVGRREPWARPPRGTPWTPAPRHLDAQRGPV